MAVTVEIEGIQATIKDNEWECKDKFMKGMLSVFSRDILTDYSPFPDLAVAKEAVKELGGYIIKITDRPKFVKGRIY
ncbi:hypothetical protein ES695_02240 [Candidatus Atribacteria bacterium 1244-E10-H5-B2]|nr:MAG: hypothetical protein ES695_02240 [Candidatus Atribacteria bacterium 1244-E10-H5-B2]